MSDTVLPSSEKAFARIEALLGQDGIAGRELFVRQLLASVDAESLAAMAADDLVQEVEAALAAIGDRPRGRQKVTTRGSALVPNGTVLEIVNDDMPFLLDSVLAEVQARGLEARLVFHPLYKVERSAHGVLQAVVGLPTGEWGDGRQESYIEVHIGAVAGLAMTEPRRQELAAAVSSILDEVRLVVIDWKPMLVRLRGAIEELAKSTLPAPAEVISEQLAFLAWLVEGNFTFLGARELKLEGSLETGQLVTEDQAGLGLLRDPEVHVLRRGAELVALTPEIRQFFSSPDPIIITKANVVSRVHRRTHMDYVGIKRYRPDGQIAGELRLVGLFTSSAYTQSPRSIPVLRRKVAAMMQHLSLPPDSHASKTLANTLDNFPRDELFQIGLDDLAVWTRGILDLDLRPRVRVFLRYDNFDRFVSALAFVPRDRFSTRVRERIGEHLSQQFGGYIAAYYPWFTEGPLVRVHFIVARRTGALPRPPADEIEDAIVGIVRTWSDELEAALAGSGNDAARLAAAYSSAFNAGYMEAFPPAAALEDIVRIERLSDDRPVAIDFRSAGDAARSRLHAVIYRLDEPIRLSERVPLLENLGFTVIEERTWEVAPRLAGGVRTVVLHDMLLETFDGVPLHFDETLDLHLEETFLAVLEGRAENDRFNRLVITAGLGWSQAAVFRAGSAYLRQLGSGFGPRYVADTLVQHPAVVRDLVALFQARFDPDTGKSIAEREASSAPIIERIETALAAVSSLDEDRILRQLLTVLSATVRTNFYQRTADGQPPQTLAFKLDGKRLDLAPAPRPYREIYVASPVVEGVHLRFAPIARGGIRWSDRAQDYRTEVLGLAKAQHVKNAVIVPAGAKGGFFPKTLARGGTREEIQAQGIAAYRTFVSAMLDVTDNIVDGSIVPPAHVVRHDGDDPYLVVAADKGTATFSDIANGIAMARGFWLGDAFASGGSAGYDHKGMGITAKGAWECVKRHFREMDHDIQATAFTAIGVGDMSGDVFGNGMLLSPVTRLVAAFDHRHIFLDPDPDPAASFAERRRLFDLPRSSWADYDPARLSPGGGIHARTAKSIPLSLEVRRLLRVEADTMTPSDLMRAILRADADLLWFGGIGTYVRSSGETDAQVGDRANDAIRVAASEINVKVVGEGANLGMTQKGRIEAAARGIRLNTDFIDNSAGVNTSDQEVNIKIALQPAVRTGALPTESRNALLTTMSEDVASAVLRNNYQQSLALSLAERQGTRDLGATARLVRDLEERGLVDRKLESLPDDHELAARLRQGEGLGRPELAVIMSYTKIALLHDLLASQAPDDPYLSELLSDYFPPALRQDYAQEIAAHQLRREIIATTLTNGIVNRLGFATPLALADATGRPVTELAFAFMAARGALGLSALWRDIDALDGQVSGAVQLDLYERVRRGLVDASSHFLRDGVAARPLGETIEVFSAGLREIEASYADVVPPALDRRIEANVAGLRSEGIPAGLAHAIARLEIMAQAPAIIVTAMRAGSDVGQAARSHLGIIGALGLDTLIERAIELSPADDYERLAIGGALVGLDNAVRSLSMAYLQQDASARSGDVASWLTDMGPIASHIDRDLAAIVEAQEMSVARLSVAAARLAALAEAASAYTPAGGHV